MPADLHEPPDTIADPKQLLEEFLDFYRGTLLAKLDGLDDSDLRRSRLPSGWTPLELLKHLTYVERRWLEWGFLGQDVGEPWGDEDAQTHRWHVRDDETLDSLLGEFNNQAATSRRIIADSDLMQRGAPGERFDAEPPTLSWILMHLLQEYARHVGHLDVVRELVDGSTGE